MVVCVACSLTFVRSAWFALIVAGLAHVVASRGASARVVFGTVAVIVVPPWRCRRSAPTAHDVVDRFKTVKNLGQDTSATERQATFSDTLPIAVQAPHRPRAGQRGRGDQAQGRVAAALRPTTATSR